MATLCAGLRAAGQEVSVLHSVQDRNRDEYTIDVTHHEGVEVHRVVNNALRVRPTPFPYHDRNVEVRFLEVVERVRPDLVHIHHLAGLSSSIPGAAKRLGLPVLWTLHDFWPLCFLSHLLTPDHRRCPGPEGGVRCAECRWLVARQDLETYSVRERVRTLGWRRALKRAPARLPRLIKDRFLGAVGLSEGQEMWSDLQALPARDRHLRDVVNLCDTRIAPSRFLRDRFVAWGARPEGFRVIPNGVSAELRGLRNRPRRVSTSTRFGYIGSLVPYKGVHLLVEAFLEAALPGAQLTLWGSAPQGGEGYVDRLRALASGDSAIRFAGRYSPHALPEVLAETDVIVVPSLLYENNPLAIQEALAAGVPVVTGDVGGMAELVRSELNGLQFQTGDLRSLAAALRRIADPALRERCGRDPASPPTIEDMVREVMAEYALLTGGAR